MHPHFRERLIGGFSQCLGEEDNSFDDHNDKRFGIQEFISDGEQDLQDVCSEQV